MTPEEIATINHQFATCDAESLLAWALERFGRKVALSSSFGAEDVVLIDILAQVDPKARIVTLDTLRLNTETYDVIDRIRSRYGMDIEIFYPDLAVIDTMVRENGYNCFYRSPELRHLCCGIRKVEPLGRALAGLDAWITGVRRDQASTRTDTDMVEIDGVHNNIVKLNPLAGWTADQVWTYIREHDVPYNALHDQGFPSIGCAPCTRAVQPGEDPRAGRWWWEFDFEGRECGIHVTTIDQGAAEWGLSATPTEKS